MSDLIREVEEELRRDRFMKLWERYGLYLVGAALLVVLSIAGWRGWEWYAARQASQIGTQFQAAIELVDEGRRFEAEAEFNRLAREGTSGYRTLARFRAAAEAARSDTAAGIEAYDALAADGSLDSTLRDLARIHAALLLVDTASPAEIAERMEPLSGNAAPFRHSAREVTGLAHFRAGEHEVAAKIFATILADPETPPSLRNRVQVLNSLVTGVGSTPPAASATPTQ